MRVCRSESHNLGWAPKAGTLLLVKTAVQLELAVKVNCEFDGFVPVHTPIQPVNVEPASAVAVSVMGVFRSNTLVQVSPQLTPAGEDETVPEPVPDLVTVSAGCVEVKLAAQAAFAARTIATLAEVPAQAPDHPKKVDPAGAAAANLTTVPAA